MNLWFTSDTHFAHANIIKYCDRPFTSVHEMDEFLIKQWNTYVRPQDHIYHLGDVSMVRPRALLHSVFKRLNGHKRLVRGNHDIYKTKEYLEAGFEEIYGVRVLDDIIFTHIPIHPSSAGRFRGNVHGHIHNNQGDRFPPVPRTQTDKKSGQTLPPFRYLNISVEVTDYHPVDLEWIRERLRS